MHSALRDSVLVLVIQRRFCNSLISYPWTWWLTITLCNPSSTCSFPAVTRITSPPLGGLATHFPCQWDCALTCAEAVVTGKKSTGLGSNRRDCPRHVRSYPNWATRRLCSIDTELGEASFWSCPGSWDGKHQTFQKMAEGRTTRSAGCTSSSFWIIDKRLR